jgi:hypothetical protein
MIISTYMKENHLSLRHVIKSTGPKSVHCKSHFSCGPGCLDVYCYHIKATLYSIQMSACVRRR